MPAQVLLRTLLLATLYASLCACVGGGTEGADGTEDTSNGGNTGGTGGEEEPKTDVTEAITIGNYETFASAGRNLSQFTDAFAVGGFLVMGTGNMAFVEAAEASGNTNIDTSLSCDTGSISVTGNLGSESNPKALTLYFNECEKSGWRLQGQVFLDILKRDKNRITEGQLVFDDLLAHNLERPQDFLVTGALNLNYDPELIPPRATSTELTLVNLDSGGQIKTQSVITKYHVSTQDGRLFPYTRGGLFTVDTYGIIGFTDFYANTGEDPNLMVIKGLNSTRVYTMSDARDDAEGETPLLLGVSTANNVYEEHYQRLPVAQLGTDKANTSAPELEMGFSSVTSEFKTYYVPAPETFYDADYNPMTMSLQVTPSEVSIPLGNNQFEMRPVVIGQSSYRTNNRLFTIKLPAAGNYNVTLRVYDGSHTTSDDFTLTLLP